LSDPSLAMPMMNAVTPMTDRMNWVTRFEGR